MKRFVPAAVYFSLLFAGVFITAESYLRFFSQEPPFDGIMGPRLWRLWGTGYSNGAFLPPFDMMANSGWNDERRLKLIFENSVPKANSDWVSHDFLLPDAKKEQSRYRIHFNNLGFRDDSDRKQEKPLGTYRIIALGTYQTFGHGVANSAAYPAQMEKILNKRFRGRPKIEVWNGGRHAGTMIIGLARLRHEIFKYQPDMILLDYGMVDPYIIGDNLFVHHFLLPDHWAYELIRRPVNAFTAVFGPSRLIRRMAGAIRKRFQPRNYAHYFATLEAALKLIETKNIPVVLIKTNMARFPDELVSRYAQPKRGVHSISIRNLFDKNPPSDADKRAFSGEADWTLEYGGAKNIAQNAFFLPVEYHLNPYQYNVRGQSLMAAGVAELVGSEIDVHGRITK